MSLVFSEIAAGVNGGAASTTYTISLTGSAAVGDLVVVLAMHDTTGAFPTTAITDTKTNTWNRSTAGAGSGGTIQATSRACYFWSVLTTALVGGTDTIKLTTSGSSHKTLQVVKVTGATSVSQDVAKNSDSQASTLNPVTGTTTATTQAAEIAFACFLFQAAPTFTAPASYNQTATTLQTATGGACSVSGCYQVLAATGTQSATATLGTAETAGGMIFTLKYTASSPPPTFVPQVVGFWTA